MIIFLFLSGISAYQVAIETFNVSLDDSAETRWNDLLISQKQEIIKKVSYFESIVPYFDRLVLAQGLLKSKYFSSEILQEMKSASLLLSVDLDSILVLNLMNEFFSEGPTFLIITDKFQAILAKNIENSFKRYKPRLIKVNFFRSGSLLYESFTEPGLFSSITSMKPFKFAVTINKRKENKSNFSIWDAFNLLSGSKSASVAIRWAMENLETFEDVLVYLNNIQLVSSYYFSIAGIDRAAVLARDPKFVADMRQTDEEKWFFVQSDSDHWLTNTKNNQRDFSAVSRINDIGREYLNEEMIFGLMNLKPTFSNETTGTLVVNPGNGFWFAVGRMF